MENSLNPVQDALFLPRHSLEQLTKKLPTPFYLYDGPGLQKTTQDLMGGFSWGEGYENFVPVSINSNPLLLKWVCQCGNGLLCTTHEGLELARDVGCPGNRVLYAPVVPMEGDLKTIAQWDGILLLDSVEAGQFAISLGHLPKRVLLGYNPSGKLLWNGHALARLSCTHQGMEPQDMVLLAQNLKQTPVEQLGISGQLGCHVTDTGFYGAVLGTLNQVRHQVEAAWGKGIFAFQLGGGVAINPDPNGSHPDFQQLGANAKAVMDREKISGEIAIHTSMGRRLLGPNGILVSRVIFTKNRKKHVLVLNLAISRIPLLQQRVPRPVSVLESDAGVGHRCYDVVGIENTDGDWLGRDLCLAPVELGNHCIVHRMGYHGAYESQAYDQYLYMGEGNVTGEETGNHP